MKGSISNMYQGPPPLAPLLENEYCHHSSNKIHLRSSHLGHIKRCQYWRVCAVEASPSLSLSISFFLLKTFLPQTVKLFIFLLNNTWIWLFPNDFCLFYFQYNSFWIEEDVSIYPNTFIRNWSIRNISIDKDWMMVIIKKVTMSTADIDEGIKSFAGLIKSPIRISIELLCTMFLCRSW